MFFYSLSSVFVCDSIKMHSPPPPRLILPRARYNTLNPICCCMQRETGGHDDSRNNLIHGESLWPGQNRFSAQVFMLSSRDYQTAQINTQWRHILISVRGLLLPLLLPLLLLLPFLAHITFIRPAAASSTGSSSEQVSHQNTYYIKCGIGQEGLRGGWRKRNSNPLYNNQHCISGQWTRKANLFGTKVL